MNARSYQWKWRLFLDRDKISWNLIDGIDEIKACFVLYEEGAHGLTLQGCWQAELKSIGYPVLSFSSQDEPSTFGGPQKHFPDHSHWKSFLRPITPECLRQQRAPLGWWGVVLGMKLVNVRTKNRWHECEARSSTEFSLKNPWYWFDSWPCSISKTCSNKRVVSPCAVMLFFSSRVENCIGRTWQPQIVRENHAKMIGMTGWNRKPLTSLLWDSFPCFSRSSDQLDLKPADLQLLCRISPNCLKFQFSQYFPITSQSDPKWTSTVVLQSARTKRRRGYWRMVELHPVAKGCLMFIIHLWQRSSFVISNAYGNHMFRGMCCLMFESKMDEVKLSILMLPVD